MPPELIEGFMPVDLCDHLADYVRENYARETSNPGSGRYSGNIYWEKYPSEARGWDGTGLDLGHPLLRRPRRRLRHLMWNIYNVNYMLPFHQDVHSDVTVVQLTDHGTLGFARATMLTGQEPSTTVTAPLGVVENPLIFPMKVGDAAHWTIEDERDGWMHGGYMEAGRISLVIRHRKLRKRGST